MNIESLEQLRALYPAPKERALKKQIDHLDVHCRDFIALSPFVVIASSSSGGGGGGGGAATSDSAGAARAMDASPRGGAPGFVKTPDAHTLLIPDAPGNNRLDTLENIVATSQVGLIFMIPGVDETLRVNGTAVLCNNEIMLDMCTSERRRPALVIRVSVQAAYLHCAKALLRSQLWNTQSHVDRACLPSAGQMLSDQTGIHTAPETQEEMRARYAPDL